MFCCIHTDGFAALRSPMSSLHWWGQTCRLSLSESKQRHSDPLENRSVTWTWKWLVLPTLLLIQHCYQCILSSGGAMATTPEKRKAPFSVCNTLFWRRHANVLFLIRESIKGKPVTVCKCYANAFTGKRCKCVGVFKGENTFTLLMGTVNGPYFPQELTDLLTFKHACMHTWTSVPCAAGIKSHQLACSSWFLWEIEQTPEGKFEFRRASLYVWPGQN